MTKYKGFGTEKSASAWAKALGLPRSTVWWSLAKKGMTVEQIAERRGVTPREYVGAWEQKRRQRPVDEVRGLLSRSGYDTEHMTMESSGAVYWRGKHVGHYQTRPGVIVLSGGDTLALRRPLVPEPKISGGAGGWVIHPDTKHAILRQRYPHLYGAEV